jgi:hypothetical protein
MSTGLLKATVSSSWSAGWHQSLTGDAKSGGVVAIICGLIASLALAASLVCIAVLIAGKFQLYVICHTCICMANQFPIPQAAGFLIDCMIGS